MSDFEDDFEEPDQTVTHGYTPPPIPADHFSLSPAWKKYKATLVEPEPSAPEPTEVEKPNWYGFATSLAGCTNQENR